MMQPNIHTFIGCSSDYQKSKIVLFGAPFDSTTSYRPGTRFASAAIRGESYGIETYSPYLDRDLCDCEIFDSGDLELPFGAPDAALSMIEAHTAAILADSKVPLMLGGEHLVTLGAVRAVHAKYPDLCIVHFDAHADLREEYLGMTLSHACVMRRCYELLGDGKIFQFGIRSGDRTEFQWAPGHVDMQEFDFNTLPALKEKIGDAPVYFTIDLDVLDPSCFPGTGTPEAGGVGFLQLHQAMAAVSQLHVVACDLCELCPPCDTSGASTALACKTLRELLLMLYPNRC